MKFYFPIVALFLVLFVGSAFGLTSFRRLYVDSGTGSDTRNDGTQELPWKTLTYAYQKARNGDIIFLSTGPYNESLGLTKTVSIRGNGGAVTINGVIQILTPELRDAYFSNLVLKSDNTQFYVPDGSQVNFFNVRFYNITFNRDAGSASSNPYFLGSDKVYIGISGGVILDGLIFNNLGSSRVTAFNFRSFSGPISFTNLGLNGRFQALIEGNDVSIIGSDLRSTQLALQRVTGLNLSSCQIGSASPPYAAVVIDDVRNGLIMDNTFNYQGIQLQGVLGQGAIKNVTISKNVFYINDTSAVAIRVVPRNRTEITLYVTGNAFPDTLGYGIFVNSTSSAPVFASNNFWGDPSGPKVARLSNFDEECNPTATGIQLSSFVRYRPWCSNPECTTTSNAPGECVIAAPSYSDNTETNYGQVLALVLGAFSAGILFSLLFLYVTVGPRYEDVMVLGVDVEAGELMEAAAAGDDESDSESEGGSGERSDRSGSNKSSGGGSGKSSGDRSNKSSERSGKSSGGGSNKSSGSRSASNRSQSASASRSGSNKSSRSSKDKSASGDESDSE